MAVARFRFHRMSPLFTRLSPAEATLFDRTPVHDSTLGGISRLSHSYSLGRDYTPWPARPFPVGSVFRLGIPTTSLAAVP